MSDAVADTHAVVWHLADPSRLSANASAALSAAESTGKIWISTVTFIELIYLIEKGRLAPIVLSELWNAVSDPTEPVEALPLSVGVASVFDRIPRGIVPDMPDRIIAATALAHGLPLVSADRCIRSLAVPGLSVVW